MNRNDWEKQVFASDLQPTQRLVALVVGSFGNWKDDREVWPSVVTVADKAGISRRQAQRHIKHLRDHGWLKETGRKQLNVASYELSTPLVETPVSQLTEVVETSVETPVTHLRVVPEKPVETSEVPVETPVTTSRDMGDVQLRHGCLTNLKEPTKEPKENLEDQEIVSASPVASTEATSLPASPVHQTSSGYVFDTSSLDAKGLEGFQRFEEKVSLFLWDESEAERAWEYYSDSEWNRQLSAPARAAAAVNKAKAPRREKVDAEW